MKALIRREARRLLPAMLLVSFVMGAALAALVPAADLLLPSRGHEKVYLSVAMGAILAGAALALFQFGIDHWNGQYAYLIHRKTGTSGLFVAKLVSGCMALGCLIMVPLLVAALWHLVLAVAVENLPADRLLRLAVAALAGFSGYGMGVFGAQIRREWPVRVLLTLLGSLAVLLLTAFVSRPSGELPSTSLASYAAAQLLVGAVPLAVAYVLFRRGSDERPWPPGIGSLFVLTAVAFFVAPYLSLIHQGQRWARKELLRSYPTILEHRADGLTLAQRFSDGYAAVDERGQPIEGGELENWNGLAFHLDPWLFTYTPSSTALELATPPNDLERGPSAGRAFGFDRHVRRLELFPTWPRAAWLDCRSGKVLAAESRSSAPDKLHELEKGQGRAGFSGRSIVIHPAGSSPGQTAGQHGALVVDPADLSAWSVEWREGVPHLREQSLPEGEALTGVERLHSFFRARSGIFERYGDSTGVVLHGDHKDYVWTRSGFSEWLDASGPARKPALGTSVAEARVTKEAAWSLEASAMDGLGFHLDVRDRQTGQVALSHDYAPRTAKQRGYAAVAWAASLLRSPLASAISFLRPHEPADVRPRRLDLFLDPLLRGRTRVWLLLIQLALVSVALAWLWRRASSPAEARCTRWAWTLAVLVFGLPAWFLFDTLKPKPRKLPQPQDLATAPLIQSA